MDFRDKPLSSQLAPIHPATPKIIRLLVEYSRGLIKNQQQAEIILFGFIVLSVIFSFLMFVGNLGWDLRAPIVGPKIENAGSPSEINVP